MRQGSTMIENGVIKVEGWDVSIRRYCQCLHHTYLSLSNLSAGAASVRAECCQLSAEVAGM